MKKLFFLGACLVALASEPVKAQAGETGVVVVRLIAVNSKSDRAVIVRPGGKSEEVILNGALNGDNLQKGAIGMQQLLERLYQEGYTLKSTFSSSGGLSTTLVFTKEK